MTSLAQAKGAIARALDQSYLAGWASALLLVEREIYSGDLEELLRWIKVELSRLDQPA